MRAVGAEVQLHAFMHHLAMQERYQYLADLLLPCAGYIGSASLLKTIARLVELLRKQNPDLIYSETSALDLTSMMSLFCEDEHLHSYNSAVRPVLTKPEHRGMLPACSLRSCDGG